MPAHFLRRALLLGFACLSMAASSAAQEPFWVPADGPYGGDVSDLAVAPDGTIFAIADNQLYRSFDGATWWAVVETGIPRLYAGGVAVDTQGRVYLSTYGAWPEAPAQVYRSLDGGATWAPFDRGLPYSYEGPPRLATGGDGSVFVLPGFGPLGSGGGLYRLDPGGEGWQPLGPFDWSVVVALAVGLDGSMLAATYSYTIDCPCSHALFRSPDGETWYPVPPDTTYADSLQQSMFWSMTFGGLVITPSGTSFVTREVTFEEAGDIRTERVTRRSRDGGVTWEPWHGPFGEGLVAYMADDRGRLYARTEEGAYASADGGETWRVATFPPGPVVTLPDGARLARVPTIGLQRSDDEGVTWHDATRGLGRASVRRVAAADGVTYVSDAYLYRRADGAAWERLAPPEPGYPVSNLLLAEAGGVLWVAAHDRWPQDRPRLFRSDDQGATWTDATPDTARIVGSLVRHPDGWLLAATSGGIYRARAEADQWEFLADSPSLVQDVQVDAAGRIFAGVSISGNIHRGALYRSDDAGQTWLQLATWDRPIYAVGVHRGVLLAATSGNAIYSSADDGATWGRASPASEHDDAVLSFFSPGDSTLYATLDGSGVWRSDDAGHTWHDTGLLALLGYARVHNLALDAGGHLLAAADWPGLYRSAQPVVLAADAPPARSGTALEAPFPNPSPGEVSIPVHLDRPGHVRVRVYDVLGREVALLHEGPLPAGSHLVRWDPGDAPSGLYLVRMEAGPARQARTLLRVR